MPKTIINNDDARISQTHAVDTTVLFSTVESGNAKIYPADITGIVSNMQLSLSGLSADISVIGVGNDAGGDYFTYAGAELPQDGAIIWTPWSYVGAMLYTRADGNRLSLTYTAIDHDLYLRTNKSPDSGSITVLLDGVEVSGSPFDLYKDPLTSELILLKANITGGEHSVEVQADISPPEIFVYFDRLELFEHVRETGGFYFFLGPAPASLETSTHNFVGNWSANQEETYAYTNTVGDSIFFYAQLDAGGAIQMRVQKTPDSGVVELYKDGDPNPVTEFDLYADPASGPHEITLFENPPDDPADSIAIELRNKDDKNPLSSGNFLYFKGSAVYYSRTDNQALELAADYIAKVAKLRGDGAILDAVDSQRVNFDANAFYACMGLLGAYAVFPKQEYLNVVRDFLVWFASMQSSGALPFDDGYWNIGYRVNPDPPPDYIPAIAPYDIQGITEIRWVDAVQALGCFVLWWYWKISGDDATKNSLLATYQKGLVGLIANGYDAETGLFYSSWQYKTASTMFLYHDSVRRYDSGGALLEEHDDSDTSFFDYHPPLGWSSYAPAGAVGNTEHYTLEADSYFDFSLPLNAGDEVRWIIQTAWDVCNAEVLISDNGVEYFHLIDVDGYSPAIAYQQEFRIYTATGAGTKYFRIRHTGTINAAGQVQAGWSQLRERYSAGQSDVLLGLVALWLLTRQVSYANLAIKILQRFPGRYWHASGQRWYISLGGDPPGNPNDLWYPFPHGYTPFAQKWSRLFAPVSLFAEGLQGLEQWFTADPDSGALDGGILPPGFSEPEHIFSSFFVCGENQLEAPTDHARYDAARQFIKDGQYFLTLQATPLGGIVFSKRYPYLYTNITGFACLALAGTRNPFTEQLPVGLGVSRIIMPRYGERG